MAITTDMARRKLTGYIGVQLQHLHRYQPEFLTAESDNDVIVVKYYTATHRSGRKVYITESGVHEADPRTKK
jgi:cbb3-type cytochrome oxidase cytochrome c subunit